MTYQITVCAMVDGLPGHTIIELSDGNVHHFPTLEKAEAFSVFLDGIGFTRERS